MKRRRLLNLVIVMLIILGLMVTSMLGACAKPAPAPAPKPAPAKEFPKTIAVTTSTTGASGYVMTVGFAKLMEEELGVRVIVAEDPTTAGRIKLVASGDAEFGNTLGFTVVKDAWDGTGSFTERQPIRIIMNEYIGGMVLISLKNEGINSTKDMKGKRVMVINKGIPYYE